MNIPGLFTEILLEYLARLNLEIKEMFNLIGKEVYEQSGKNQEPVCLSIQTLWCDHYALQCPPWATRIPPVCYMHIYVHTSTGPLYIILSSIHLYLYYICRFFCSLLCTVRASSLGVTRHILILVVIDTLLQFTNSSMYTPVCLFTSGPE